MTVSPQIICLTNGIFQQNCFIVADPGTRDAVLVDPGEEAELFLRRIAHERFVLRAIWLTHAHLDHILGVQDIIDHTKVPIYLHPADRPLYDNIEGQAKWLGVGSATVPLPDRELQHGDQLTVGNCSFEARHVPGHSPGGVAFVGNGVVLSGDALFAGSIGRTDLPGGETATLLVSIREQLLTLPDDTIVYCGHGPETTIGTERSTNPFLTGIYAL
ncbi:MAG: MBL fold metallo-hydrolase [Gemmatimonadota bacterium]|nr:MAG: MBL fold metallo-hydrolase [Gemmatimonadota bacterium]